MNPSDDDVHKVCIQGYIVSIAFDSISFKGTETKKIAPLRLLEIVLFLLTPRVF